MRSLTRSQFQILVESDATRCSADVELSLGRDLHANVWEDMPVSDPNDVDELIARGLVTKHECPACTMLDTDPSSGPVTHTTRTPKGNVALSLYGTNPELLNAFQLLRMQIDAKDAEITQLKAQLVDAEAKARSGW